MTHRLGFVLVGRRAECGQDKKMIRRPWTSFTLFLLLFVIIGGALAEPIDGPTVLRRMLAAEGTAAFIAHQVTTLTRGPALTSEQTVYRDGFRGMRTEYISPPQLAGEIMVDNGKEMIHFVPGHKVARVRPSRLFALKQRTQEAARAFLHGALDVELVGKDKIADRPTFVLVVKPRGKEKAQTRKFWVDSEKWIKLKTEDIGPDGTVLSTSYYTKIEFLDKLPQEKFQFEPPPGVKIERGPARTQVMPLEKVRQLVKFRILEPTYLPNGFKCIGATAIPFRQGKIVVLRYSDGILSFSLFQTPGRVLDRGFLQRLRQGPSPSGKNIYSWRRGDLNLTLVGPIPLHEVQKIAESVR